MSSQSGLYTKRDCLRPQDNQRGGAPLSPAAGFGCFQHDPWGDEWYIRSSVPAWCTMPRYPGAPRVGKSSAAVTAPLPRVGLATGAGGACVCSTCVRIKGAQYGAHHHRTPAAPRGGGGVPPVAGSQCLTIQDGNLQPSKIYACLCNRDRMGAHRARTDPSLCSMKCFVLLRARLNCRLLCAVIPTFQYPTAWKMSACVCTGTPIEYAWECTRNPTFICSIFPGTILIFSRPLERQHPWGSCAVLCQTAYRDDLAF